jgi:hypothetical protein
MTLTRQLEPEWLDLLPAADPRARASRRDLRLVNRLMGHAPIRWRALADAIEAAPPERIVELGAGDGSLMLTLAGRWPSHRPAPRVILVDRVNSIDPAVMDGLSALGWRLEVVTADVFDWLRGEPPSPREWVLANLFLHHFPPLRLGELLTQVADRASLFVATEPRRSWFALAASHLLGMVGCNDVSRHDAVVSVRAGFARDELSALWPPGDDWCLREGRAGLFSHCFVARHRASEGTS